MRYTLIDWRMSQPTTGYGAILRVRYRLFDDRGVAFRDAARIAEQMTVLTDPYRVRGAFRTGPGNASGGCFNDQYSLASRDPLPEDFEFEVRQIYKANGEPLLGQNKVRYSALMITLWMEDRGRMKIAATVPMRER